MPRGAISRMRRTETPKPIWMKFCLMVDIHDVVTHTNFGDHRLRGFWVEGGQISPFPIDFHRRPYNTRTTVRVCDYRCKLVKYSIGGCPYTQYILLFEGYGVGLQPPPHPKKLRKLVTKFRMINLYRTADIGCLSLGKISQNEWDKLILK